MPSFRSSIVALAALASMSLNTVVAHPGESHEALAAETAKRAAAFRSADTHLRKRCAAHFEARGHEKRAMERRKALHDKLRAERGISKRGRWFLSLSPKAYMAGGGFQAL